MMTKEEIQGRLAKLVQEHGKWTFDIPLPRLKRVSQIVDDLAAKPQALSKRLGPEGSLSYHVE